MTTQTVKLEKNSPEADFDESRTDAFAQRMMDMINGGSIAMMTSIGHRTGLFDVMANFPPVTTLQIARASGLNERYIKEWLGAMVTGGIIEYNPKAQTYFLPREHAAVLTRAASPNNIAAFAQYIAVLGSVEDKIVECFKQGGGVPYSAYGRFHEVMAEDSEQTVVSALEEAILPLVPGLVEALEAGIEVMDVGCGSGRALNKMAALFPNSRFVGYDISRETIEAAVCKARELGLTNIQFQVKDAAAIEAVEQFDLITAFDAIHDQAKPDLVLAKINQALKADGLFLMQDIYAHSHVDGNLDNPAGPFMYTISCMHCMSVSLATGGDGLGAMWGEEKAQEMLQEAGFNQVEIKKLEHDFQNNYYLVRKS
ncbi:Methyltransferase type 12 [Thalassoporum mexicanum PCC 7367]|uniref:class I SAM-dependent methyltransferase n=1 Tax=Thalassoporum mexicanum TaxID=3457544 RepID=UPI00029F8C37|nr:class I SAM-dependent methyltransferase [Pseudanabaena sp. PCC 7367]AFY69411.1 Methyltransferase type 12 [Pseudanabaena sp. PCC 7367]